MDKRLEPEANTGYKSGSDDPAHDPLEAIYALNIGDIVADSFFSDELLTKISTRMADDPTRLRKQLEELIHIYSIDKTLGILGLDAQEGFIIYDSIAATLCQMYQLDACHLFQTARKENGEEHLSLTGTSQSVDSRDRWDIAVSAKANNFLSDSYRGYETTVVNDLNKIPNWIPLDKLGQQHVKSVMATPLREGGKALGLLVMESCQANAMTDELVNLADATARVFVTSMRLQQLVAEAQVKVIQNASEINTLLNMRAQITESIADLGIHQQEFVEALSTAVDARHHFTRGHSRMVGEMARAIAEELQLNEKTVDLTYIAGLVGSLGKVNISRDTIGKKDALRPEELDRLKDHPNVGVSLLVKINFLSEVIPYVHSQNERWDGSGNPEGLKGNSIPLGSRILAVSNAYYGMTQDRPYREGEKLTHPEALKAFQEEAGSKWDPLVVDALSKIAPDSLI